MASTADRHNDPSGAVEHQPALQAGTAEVSSRPQATAVPLHREEALVAIARRVVTASVVDVLLEDAAALLADAMGMEHHAVVQIAADQRTLRHTLTIAPLGAGTRPSTYLSEQPCDQYSSLAGHAIAQGRPVFSEKLVEEKAFRDYFLSKHKIHSALAIPLGLQGEMFGALVAASSRPKELQQRDLLLAEIAGHLVAATLGRLRAEVNLTGQQRMVERLLHAAENVIFLFDAGGAVLQMNPAAEQLTGFAVDQIHGRQAVEVFAPSEQKQLWLDMWEQLRRGRAQVCFSSELITCDCEQPTIHWRWSAVRNPDGTLRQVIASGATENLPLPFEEHVPEDDGRKQSTDGDHTAEAEPDTSPDHPPRGRRRGRPARRLVFRKDRRRKVRRAYPYLQRVAPVLEHKLPEPEQFVDVECHDISPGGFSFVFPYPFPSDSLVVELGVPPKFTYLMAQVAHVTRINRGKQTYYLIGCNYTHRVRY